jgi:hypothetical protein
LPGILENRKYGVSETRTVSVLREGKGSGGEDYLVGSLRKS